MRLRVTETNLGWTSRFYGPVNEELNGNEPPILTPERMAYHWWVSQKLIVDFEGENLIAVYKNCSRDEPPDYRLIWRDFLGQVKKGSLMAEKLVPMLGLFSDLAEKGLDVGKVRIFLRHPGLRGLGSTRNDDYSEVFLLDQIVQSANQELVNGSSHVLLEAKWLLTEIDNHPPHYAVLAAQRYFGVDVILKCFASSYYNPTSPALKHLDKVGQRLEDLLKGFPPAPRVQADE